MKIKANNILCLVLSFLTISARAQVMTATVSNSLNAILVEGKTYNFIAGNNNFYTNAVLTAARLIFYFISSTRLISAKYC